MAKFYLSIGANLGNREETLKRAVALLDATPEVTVKTVSPFTKRRRGGRKINRLLSTVPFWWRRVLRARSSSNAAFPLNGSWGGYAMKMGRPNHRYRPRLQPGRGLPDAGADLAPSLSNTKGFRIGPLRDLQPDLILFGRPIDDWLAQLPDTDAIRRKD